MRRASCRWLKPLPSRSVRIVCASIRCPRPLECWLMVTTSAIGVMAASSASSSSNERWQRRQRLLDVRNCTKKQRSHRTTSRESTGANVVAIEGLRVPERWATLKTNYSVICGIGPVEVKTKVRENKVFTGSNHKQAEKSRNKRVQIHATTRSRLVFTN